MNFSKFYNFNATIAFYVIFSTFPPNLVTTGRIVEKWQPIFEIQDGGDRPLDFSCICVLDMTFPFGVTFSTFPLNLVRIGPLVKKWQPIFEIKDGGGRHI